MARVFSDTAGTTPATYGGSVALVFDGNGALTLGPELVTNGTFDEDISGWGGGVSTWEDGEILVERTSGQVSASQFLGTLVAGRTYHITGNRRSISGSAFVNISLRDGASATSTGSNELVGISSPPAFFSFLFTPQATQSVWLHLRLSSDNGVEAFDNISIREIIGYPNRHAVQSSASLRPLLGRAPVAGRRNLFLRTEEFNNSYWSTNNCNISANASQAPDGTMTADRVTPTGSFSRVFANNLPIPNSTTFTVSLWVKELAPSGSIRFNILDDSNNSLKSQTYGGDLVLDQWVRVSTTFTSAASGMTTLQLTRDLSSTGIIDIWGAQLDIGSLTDYQRVGASALDVTEAGLAAPGFLRFDRVDDRLAHAFPSGFDGDLLIFGRSGSWVQEHVTVAAGGTLTIGPSTVPGAPAGLLAALGDIVGWLPVGRTTTQAERNKMRDYYMARGAKGFLVEGPELVPNPTFADSASGWSLGGGWSVAVEGIRGGPSNNTFANANMAAGSLLSGRAYINELEYKGDLSNRFVALHVGGLATSPWAVAGAASGTVRATQRTIRLQPSGTNQTVNVYGTGANGGYLGDVYRVSVKELRPEEEW